ncbi:glutathione S-transferase [Hasllibacter halocynthiae]|uniref:Glutathione S-transferase n=1 Tax=Hasllibacter halocynthiae TaxID=595589 RepID=A0A2T0X203_9RHOB|nr:glutathione S-transferase [Hasllibacter halocynthiae]PRY92968.1 glutathione S-transferase [Hasllibacter halocynthiae]
MPYDLAIGDRAYSSWSLRGWLLLAAFGLPVRVRRAQLRTDELPVLLERFAPARTVPAMRCPDGAIATDSLAIAEELASRHPGAGHWPGDPAARALARSLVAEMHSGFAALRAACPMNLRQGWAMTPGDAVRADLARLEALWALARERAEGGPWLSGPYGAADAFFAPVAMRIAGYDLPVGEAARAYVDAHLGHGPLLEWRDLAMEDGPDQTVYEQDLPRRPFPWPDGEGR